MPAPPKMGVSGDIGSGGSGIGGYYPGIGSGAAVPRPSVGFGSQTSRFNVAGVHPRSLKPGTCVAASYSVKEEVCPRMLHAHITAAASVVGRLLG